MTKKKTTADQSENKEVEQKTQKEDETKAAANFKQQWQEVKTYFKTHRLVTIIFVIIFVGLLGGLSYYLYPDFFSSLLSRDGKSSMVGGSREKEASDSQDYYSDLMEEEEKEIQPIAPPKVEVSPSPVPIKHGPETYSVSQSDKTLPQIREVRMNPLDPTQGQTQTIEVEVEHSQPVEAVSLTLTTDEKETNQDLELASGDATNGTWQTTWQVDDTYYYQYTFGITAKSDKESSVEITVR